jgi:hypothetical protein
MSALFSRRAAGSCRETLRDCSELQVADVTFSLARKDVTQTNCIRCSLAASCCQSRASGWTLSESAERDTSLIRRDRGKTYLGKELRRLRPVLTGLTSLIAMLCSVDFDKLVAERKQLQAKPGRNLRGL